MTNNDILRQIRYAFEYNDDKMKDIFSLVEFEATRSQVCDWLKKEDEDSYVKMEDKELATFLNGFINEKRGKKDGTPMRPEDNLNNNIVFRKLKIALNLNDVEILSILDLANMRVSKHELSAFFRNPSQRQYRKCNDQFLRNFLYGMQLKYREAAIKENEAKGEED
jgi:uncharacterized protein YehS (DUF1456 family)